MTDEPNVDWQAQRERQRRVAEEFYSRRDKQLHDKRKA